jgi:Zn-dependent protease with chaperone function
MTRTRRLGGLACLVLLLGAAAPVLAQNAPPRNMTADLQVYIGEDGTADLYLTLPAPPADPRAVEEAVRQAFDRPFQHLQGQAIGGAWSLAGHCEGAFSWRGLTRAGEVRLAPLGDALRPLGVFYLGTHFFHPALPLSRCSRADVVPYRDDQAVRYSFWVVPTVEVPRPIELEFGYPRADLVRLVPLGLLLLVPPGLTLWWRQSALRAGPADPLAVWFAYRRRQGFIAPGTWLVWPVAVCLADVIRLVDFVLGEPFGVPPPSGIRLSAAALFLIAPALVLLLCQGLAAPVLGQIPDGGGTAAPVWKRFLSGLVVVGIYLVIGLVGTAGRPDAYTVLGPVLLGGCLGLVVLSVTRVLPGRRSLEPLPPGELRDRISELAERAETPVQQIYLLPPVQWRLVNVFAVGGHALHLTEPLLQFSKRELDALVNHELAYLWRCRVRRLWATFAWLFLVLLAAGGFAGLVFLGRIDPVRWWPCVLLPLPVLPLLFRFGLFRYGPGQDAAAASLGGDPEAVITALVKLRRLNLLPLWSWSWEPTPPAEDAPWPRVERLAERVNIPPDRLRELLPGPGTGGEPYPPLPATQRPPGEERLFTTAFNAQLSVRVYWWLLCTLVVGPVLAAHLLRRAGGGDPTLRWVLALAGLGGVAALYLLVRDVAAVWGYQSLGRQLAARLEKQGFGVRAGVFVGYAPSAVPRIYEGNFDWDVGFLVFDGDRLCYVGDQARFCLRREQITDVRVAWRAPTWLPARRVYVTWHDPESGRGGTFSLRVADAGSLRWVDRRSRALGKRLWTWREQPATAPAAMPDFAVPDPLPAVGISPRAAVTLSGSARFLSLVLLSVGGLAVISGLPLQPREGGEALYALFVAAALVVGNWVPFWLYRDPREGLTPPAPEE